MLLHFHILQRIKVREKTIPTFINNIKFQEIPFPHSKYSICYIILKKKNIGEKITIKSYLPYILIYPISLIWICLVLHTIKTKIGKLM